MFSVVPEISALKVGKPLQKTTEAQGDAALRAEAHRIIAKRVNSNPPLPRRKRWKIFLFPPCALVPLWRRRDFTLRRKLFRSLGILLCSLVYAAAALLILHGFFGLEFEMRGRPIPVPTFSKNVPDYQALDESRKKQSTPPASLTIGSFYWTEFRGPGRSGHYAQAPIETNWPSPGLPALWRQPVGGGYASFTVAGGRAFTIEQRREDESVTAYNTATGRELWARTYPASFREWMGGDGPRATPTFHEDRIYALGAQGNLHCLQVADGKAVWHRNILSDGACTNLPYGTAVSPLIVDDKVIVTSGARIHEGSRTVLAYALKTGEPVWKTLTNKMAYVSPMRVSLAGQDQLLIVGGMEVFGLNPGNGNPFWMQSWPVAYDNNIAQPVIVATNRFFVSSGYGAGCAVFELSKAHERFQVRTVWKNKSLKNKFSSSVLWENHLYGLDEDILTCLDAETGERKWKNGRYGYGQVLLASGHLIILTGDGQLALVRATPRGHEEVRRFQAIKGKTWNHPALADGQIFVRNSAEMASFQIGSIPVR